MKSGCCCTVKHFLISPQEIHFLRFILEAYDGMAVVTTLDREAGLVQVNIAPGCEEVVEQVLNAEASGLRLRPATVKTLQPA
jgi:hypothetical protein